MWFSPSTHSFSSAEFLSVSSSTWPPPAATRFHYWCFLVAILSNDPEELWILLPSGRLSCLGTVRAPKRELISPDSVTPCRIPFDLKRFARSAVLRSSCFPAEFICSSRDGFDIMWADKLGRLRSDDWLCHLCQLINGWFCTKVQENFFFFFLNSFEHENL